MGKITGFMEFQRQKESYLPADSRVKNYKEFILPLKDVQAKTEGARCMDCGTPFCMTGCPVNNIIPDWNQLVYSGNYREALETLHSTNNFPEFTGRICPAPCESACVLAINNDAVGFKSIEHFIIDKGWKNGWVMPQPAAFKTGKKLPWLDPALLVWLQPSNSRISTAALSRCKPKVCNSVPVC